MKEDDAEVMKLRRWFRQTKAHNTMVLGKSEDHEDIGAENISKAEGKLLLKECRPTTHSYRKSRIQ